MGKNLQYSAFSTDLRFRSAPAQKLQHHLSMSCVSSEKAEAGHHPVLLQRTTVGQGTLDNLKSLSADVRLGYYDLVFRRGIQVRCGEVWCLICVFESWLNAR